jgi:solute carrier family 39 (zinc transporter), member 9
MAGGNGLGVSCDFDCFLARYQNDRLTGCDRSFLAGALPLSMTLSQSQLRLLSSIGIGILVGTSLIVIIPEGIEAVVSSSEIGHSHATRSILLRSYDPISTGLWSRDLVGLPGGEGPYSLCRKHDLRDEINSIVSRDTQSQDAETPVSTREEPDSGKPTADQPKPEAHPHGEEKEDAHIPTFYIGFSLILGFVLMFLIDRLPRHATDSLQPAQQTRHISLENLGGSSVSGDEESEGFLGSLAPTPKQSRSLATTTGLVIHAAADGIAMGASATTDDMKLGFIIFFAIMIHKAPAAFGLTSVLLKQGLSKRAARGHLIVFSLAAPVGAIATYLLIEVLGGTSLEGEAGQWWTGMLLLFSAGTFL